MAEMSREHSLFEELRQARRKLGAAKVEEQDAKTALSGRKAARLKAEALIEEILGEIDTGKSGRPLIDAANARGGIEEAVGQAVGIMERAAEAETQAVLAARKANRGGGKPADEDEDESASAAERWRWPTATADPPAGPKRAEPIGDDGPVPPTGEDFVQHIRSAKLHRNEAPVRGAAPPAKKPRKPKAAAGSVREPVISPDGPNRQLDAVGPATACQDPDNRDCRCPSCLVAIAAEESGPAAETLHWDVYRWYGTKYEGKRGPRIGSQIARTGGEARTLAGQAWKGPIEIGGSHPHGPDCGCGTGPEPAAAKPAVRKPDPLAAELAADTAAATEPVKLWAVHRYDEAAKGRRGDRLGTVNARDRTEALSLALDHAVWAPAGRLVIGEEVAPAPVANLGQVDHPASNARIAERLIGGKPPANGRPSHTPGPYNQDEALIRATALPEVRDELARLTAEGGTDQEILRVLIQWPSERKSYPDGSGNPWAVCGGAPPRFWYDSAALDDFPVRKRPTLAGDALVKDIRRVLHIRRPKPSAADRQPVRARKPKAPAAQP